NTSERLTGVAPSASPSYAHGKLLRPRGKTILPQAGMNTVASLVFWKDSNGMLSVRRVADYRTLATRALEAGEALVTSLADSDFLVAQQAGRFARILALPTLREVRRIPLAETESVFDPTPLSPHGGYLLTQEGRTTLSVYAVSTGKRVMQCRHDD